MRLHQIIAFAFGMIALVASAHGDKVRVVVRVPAGTPSGEVVYIAGSLPAVGGWKADGVKLHREENGNYAGELELERGDRLEFKVTRGSWETVEKAADGNDRGNRVVVIEDPAKAIEVSVEAWGVGGGKVGTVVGALKLHTIDSAALKGARTIRVWLPPGYDANASESYGVLYMHDGQNCFDKVTAVFGHEWGIDEAMTRLIAEKKVRPLIVVGLDHGGADRIAEYTYSVDGKLGGGRGGEHGAFLLREVRPLIERTYRVKADQASTFIGGSSLGGVISLEVARRHPGVFGGVIAMSPALQWAGGSLVDEVKKDPGGLKDAKVWIDMGTRERVITAMGERTAPANQELVDLAVNLSRELAAHHVNKLGFIEPGGEHNESAWARRFPRAVRYVIEGEMDIDGEP